MQKTIGLALAALIAGAGAAQAQTNDGFSVSAQGFAASTQADADFPNADKLDNELSGALAGIRLGAEYQFGDDDKGLVVGASYATTLGDGITSEPIRNGNYLVHHTVLDGFSGWDASIGWDFGPLTLGVAWGQLTRDVTTFQSCPEDSDAVPFGYCGNATFRQQREGLRGGSPEEDTADSFRAFGQWEISRRFYLEASYLQAEFGQSITPLDVIGAQPADRTAHGPTSMAQDFEVLSVGAGIRF